MAKAEHSAADSAIPHAVRTALERYTEPLLRSIATQYARPRLQWTPDEMRERILASVGDPASIDRTLKSVSSPARRLLKLIGLSRQSRWRVQALVDFTAITGSEEGAAPIRELLQCGLLAPELSSRAVTLSSFDAWLSSASATPLVVWAMPLAASRARKEPLELPRVDSDAFAAGPRESDGLEWPLRLAVVWQTVRATPLRLTQSTGLFKRDLDRLRTHPMLAAASAEEIGPVPDPAMLALALAQADGVLVRDGEEIRTGEFSTTWTNGLGSAMASLWEEYVGLDGTYWSDECAPAFAVLALAMLSDLAPDQWAIVGDVDNALAEIGAVRGSVTVFLLGIAHQLRLVQGVRQDDHWRVRLTEIGRSLLAGETPKAPSPTAEQTLLVQPNLEIVLFRQGVTPDLIKQISQFAEWQSLGSACTLRLTAESVYQGLESGQSLSDILALLERHGTRGLSENVLGTLRSWASKRDRVLVFPSALVLEFRTSTDLDRALREGLIEQRITDRIGVISSESRIDYQQFRFIGTRDYLAPDEQCVEVDPHGLDVAVNENKSDLLLESELRRFAEPVERNGDDRPRFRMTLDTLRTARRQGLNAEALDAWFRRRAGEALPPAAKLLISGDQAPPFALSALTVLRTPTAELADGLTTWPETAPLIAERLGPTLLAVPGNRADELRTILASLGVRVDSPAD